MLKLKFKVLSPLHISNGNNLGYGIHYFVKEKIFYKFNYSNIAKFLAKENAFPLKESTGPSEIVDQIIKYFPEYNPNCFEYEIETVKAFSNDFTTLNNKYGEMEVKEFINVNGKFYIPGSSIKGAILTAMNKSFLGIDHNKEKGDYKTERFVINDSQYLTNDNFCVYRTNIRDSHPKKIRAFFICLMPNANFEILIQKLGTLTISDLISSLNKYSNRQIKEVNTFLQTFLQRNDSATKLFSDSLNYILDKSKELKDNEAIINLGLGGGNWFKTINHKPIDKPAHTSFSFGGNENPRHMGWCKVSLEEINE